MASSLSVQQLVALVRTRTGELNSPTFDDTTELKPWLRQSMAQLYEILVSRWQDWYVVVRPLSLIANQESYSLPNDFREMTAVYLLYNQNVNRPPYREKLRNCTDEEWGAFNSGNFGMYSYTFPMWYQIKRQQIYFTPGPQQDMPNVIEFHYTPAFSGPLLDYTPIDPILPAGWDEWVVLDTIQKMRGKMNLDIEDLMKAKSEQQARLIAAASIRGGDAPRMTDVMSSGRRPSWAYGLPSGPAYWSAP